jgi:hypothetical protein
LVISINLYKELGEIIYEKVRLMYNKVNARTPMKTSTMFSFLTFITLPAGFSDSTIPAAVTYKLPDIAVKSYVSLTVSDIL